MSENIFSTIQEYEHDFLHRTVKIVDSYEFDQLNTIKKILIEY